MVDLMDKKIWTDSEKVETTALMMYSVPKMADKTAPMKYLVSQRAETMALMIYLGTTRAEKTAMMKYLVVEKVESSG